MLLMLRSLSYGQALQTSTATANASLPYLDEIDSELERLVAAASPIGGSTVGQLGPVSFDSVCFSYDGASTTLRDLNFQLREREVVGVVGPSGSGKSTMVQLLLGLREPSIYGAATLKDVEARCRAHASGLGMGIEFRQSNVEGELVTWIHEAREAASGIAIGAHDFFGGAPRTLAPDIGAHELAADCQWSLTPGSVSIGAAGDSGGITIGSSAVTASYDAATSTATALRFNATIVAGQNDANGIAIAADSLALNGGAIVDAASGRCYLVGHVLHRHQYVGDLRRAFEFLLALAGDETVFDEALFFGGVFGETALDAVVVGEDQAVFRHERGRATGEPYGCGAYSIEPGLVDLHTVLRLHARAREVVVGPHTFVGLRRKVEQTQGGEQQGVTAYVEATPTVPARAGEVAIRPQARYCAVFVRIHVIQRFSGETPRIRTLCKRPQIGRAHV